MAVTEHPTRVDRSPVDCSSVDCSSWERFTDTWSQVSLSPILRTLLTTDGTVTEVLAAYFGETVGVTVAEQGTRGFDPVDDRLLGEEIPHPLLDRTIYLEGRNSHRRYVAARSQIVAEFLPPALKADLLAGRQPLGRLLMHHRLESFREIIDGGCCRADAAPQVGHCCDNLLEVAGDTPVVWRRYRVIAGGRPAMLITECFVEALA